MNDTSKSPKISAALSFCLALCMMSPIYTYAQLDARPYLLSFNNPTDHLDSIIITSTKRGRKNINAAPLSIKAIIGNTLSDIHALEFEHYSHLITGLSFEDNGPGDRRYILRGLRSTGAATTGVYFDEMVITGSNRQDGGGRQPDIELVDIQQIDVLKGPQGTLYGASSMGGTIRMMPNAPNLYDKKFIANGELSNTANGSINYRSSFIANMPVLKHKGALRVVAYHSDDSGYFDNLQFNERDINDSQTTGGRVAFRAEPLDHISISLTALHQKTQSDGAGYRHPQFSQTGHFDYHHGGRDDALSGYSATLNWELTQGYVTAVSSLFNRKVFYIADSSWVLSSFGNTRPDQLLSQLNQPQEYQIWSNELRYNSDWNSNVSLVAGVYYQQEQTNFQSNSLAIDNQGNVILPQLNYLDRSVDSEQNQSAIFGELSYQLSHNLSLTLGLRAFDMALDQTSQNTIKFTLDGTGNSERAVYSSSADNGINHKVNLSYQYDDNVLFYFTNAQGFRSGGANDPGITTENKLSDFNSDKLTSYEVGMKSEWFNKRLAVNGAVYYLDWSDMQVRSVIDDIGLVINAGKAHIKGLELDVNSLIGLNIQAGAGLTLLEAELDEDEPSASGAFHGLKGDRLINVPKVSWNTYIKHVTPIDTFNALRVMRLDIAYIGDSFSAFRPNDGAYFKVGDYYSVNMSLGFKTNSWKTQLFARNLLNDISTRSVTYSSRRPVIEYTQPPRTIGISIEKQF